MQKIFENSVKNLKKYLNLAKKVYRGERTGHGLAHIKRCLSFERKICENETFGDEFDYDSLIIATIFHDVHRVMSSKNKGKYVSPNDSIPRVMELLKPFSLPKEKLNKISYMIANHEKREIKARDELKVLQDADILDSLGKMGLRRTQKYCKARGIPVFNPKFSLDSQQYIPNIFPISTTHYVYRTMIPSYGFLKTETAKKLGKDKVLVLQKFVDNNLKRYKKRSKKKF